MNEEIIAKVYARAIIELSDEYKIDLPQQLTELNILINQSNDLENLLFLEVFTLEEKQSVMNVIIDKMHFSLLLHKFINFLLEEKRIHLLPLLYKEVMVIDDDRKGFIRCTVEGKEDDGKADPEVIKRLSNYLKEKIGKKVEVKYKKNEDIIAGYRVTAEDLQLDVTVDNQLKRFKESLID